MLHMMYSLVNLLNFIKQNPCVPDGSLIHNAFLVDPLSGGATNLPIQLKDVVKDEKLIKEFHVAMGKEVESWVKKEGIGSSSTRTCSTHTYSEGPQFMCVCVCVSGSSVEPI
eukprot:GHVR01167508.1.p1 GENE.GHVR01167508.1~~GHVR01167508.1.p1  ORF type:complete len:112 (-),score=19.12 GHVR01167508.1:378-713(-)